jgi:CHAD domain-containing protein
MRDQTKVFHLDPGESERSSGLLSNEFVIRQEALVPGIRTYYDTFDWRLFRKKLTVEKVRFRDKTEVHVRLFDGQLVAETPLALEPGFAWDLPEGTLRAKLAPILQMRRLLPLAEMSFRGSRLNVLNADEKTVARVIMGQRKAWQPWENTPENVLPASLKVVPIRGYEKEYEHLLQFVESQLPVEEVAESELATVLESVGRTPCDYSSKLNVQLEPGMPAGEATRTVFRTLLETLLINEKGTRLDLDSEFLHDFRVAIRRTRAGLAQLKGVISPEIRDRFKRDFSWIGGATGSSRDLDVYLLKMPKYRNSVPQSVREHLDPLTDFLVAEKAAERKKLIAALDSKRYRNLVADWRAVLDDVPEAVSDTPVVNTPIKEVASKKIWKIYRRVLKMGALEGGSVEAEVLHRLRIECKKLRYMMEFFRNLYESKEIKGLIKVLRRLQDNLGDFNDCEIQQLKLKEFARSMMDRGGFSPETFMALGCLVERLEMSQAEEVGRFEECFRDFSRPENQERFRSLFSPKSGQVGQH